MSEKDKENKEINSLPFDQDESQGEIEATGETLKFNEEQDSFELDVDVEDTDYDHPLPYETATTEAQEDGQIYDEANPYAQNEYQQKGQELDGELQELDDVVTSDDVQLDPVDEALSQQPEDLDDNLDEEGYPKKDADLDSDLI